MALIQKPFGDIITFSRSSGGGRFNAAGQYEWLASNAPRFDYDPATLSPRGLLVEEQRTNTWVTGNGAPYRLGYNQSNAAMWAPMAEISPVGLCDAAVITAPTGSVTVINFAKATSGHPNGTVITQSIFVKILTWASPFTIYFGNGNSTGGVSVPYSYSNGTLSTAYSGASVVKLANGWHRLICTYTATADVDPNFTITMGAGGKYAVWGGQVEQATFATSYIQSSLTFSSRASTATYFDSNGVLQIAGVNVARTGYSFVNNAWVSQGLVVEDARTNLLTFSAGFDSWAQTGISFGINALAAPDGTTSADKLIETATTEVHRLAKIVPVSINTTYVASVYAKAGELRYFGMKTGVAESPTNVVFDLVSGTIVSGAASGMTITPAGNGWYRCAVTFTPTSSTQAIMYWTLLKETNFANELRLGDGVSGLYLWGAQLEAGAYPTSYIPTTTAQVTRAADMITTAQVTRSADVASINVLSPWYNANEGTFSVTWNFSGFSSGYRTVIRSGTASDRLDCYIYNSSVAATFEVRVGNVQQAILSQSTLVAGQTNKVSMRYGSNDFASSVNGGAAQTDTSGSVPAVTSLLLGHSGSGASNICGHIQSIKYFPKRLTNAELQALTT